MTSGLQISAQLVGAQTALCGYQATDLLGHSLAVQPTVPSKLPIMKATVKNNSRTSKKRPPLQQPLLPYDIFLYDGCFFTI